MTVESPVTEKSRRPLHLMVVEDCAADAELIVATLKRAGFALAYDTVTSSDAFEQKLQQTECDLILCDHNLMGWTGMDALSVLRRLKKEIPLIVVTAVLGDEGAVDYIKRGAVDYVLKHRLERLPVAVGRALREKAQREESLRLQEVIVGAKREWELTFDAVRETVLVLDAEARITRANRAAAELAGLKFSQMIGRRCREVLECWDGQNGPCPRDRMLQTGKEECGEVEMPHRGKVFEAAISPLREGTGQIKGAVCVMRDITERKRAEESLRRSEERYRELLETANDAIYTTDLSGNLASINRMGEQLSGYARSEFLQMHIDQIVAPEYAAVMSREIDRALAGEQTRIFDIEILAKDGHRVPLEVNSRVIWQDGKPAGILAIARDTSVRKHLEEQLRQAQKMEAIALLAGGIAHDFNNLLNVVLGYGALLLENLEAGDRRYRYAEQIRAAGERAAALTRQLLAFGRKQVLQPRAIDLNELIADMDQLLKRLLSENIEVKLILDPELGRAKADAGQIEQVIMNLAINARDAMPQGGKLTIQTANVELDEDYARQHTDVLPGLYVMLAVSDTGTGMDPATQARVFEPFFTTKPAGKGTGLGLATAHGIVRQSGGTIWLYSEPGHGATFKIYLPRVQESAEPLPSRTAESAPGRGTETVLLVEDESSLRELTRKFLEEHGYTVLQAENGLKAIEVAERHAGPIHLLLTDVVMPGMTGHKLAQELESSRPQMKVVYMSGYTDEAITNHGILKPGTSFIEKPFTREALLRKVHNLLHAEVNVEYADRAHHAFATGGPVTKQRENI